MNFFHSLFFAFVPPCLFNYNLPIFPIIAAANHWARVLCVTVFSFEMFAIFVPVRLYEFSPPSMSVGRWLKRTVEKPRDSCTRAYSHTAHTLWSGKESSPCWNLILKYLCNFSFLPHPSCTVIFPLGGQPKRTYTRFGNHQNQRPETVMHRPTQCVRRNRR